ncbi:MAG: hypothetical protein NVS4B1_02920 [Ktedonobacteraceae bacterium]
MAGRYAKKETLQEPLDSFRTKSAVPARATRQLPAIQTQQLEEYDEDLEPHEDQLERVRYNMRLALDKIRSLVIPPKPLRFTPSATPVPVSAYGPTPKVVDQYAVHPLERHKPWLYRFIIVAFVVVIALGVLLSAAMLQRPGDAQLINLPGFGKVYDVQVGGTLANQVQQTNGPITPKVPLHTGPYSVLGAPSVTADFINRVLAAYSSPAAGKGQALYDMGVKYGIDPAFALAFFQHESSFGKAGEARSSLSLGNLRCIPDAQCTNNYAWFPTWEAGFEAWYKLIRNLYVAVWGLTTVDQIIPRYAPNADNNNEAAYIAALKRELDVWHAGQLYV